ncbi:MAG: outer membrane protein assembly factor BamD [Reinekea sp.]
MALVLMLSATLFVGCAGNRTKLNDTESDYYYSAQEYLDKKNYTMAIERLNELESRFPFGLYAKAGLLDLMYAHYESGDYTDSLAEADRFTRLNSDHPNVDYAWFVKAMSYYKLFLANSGIFGKADPAQRSSQQGARAFQSLERFTSLYPDSEYRPEALKAMIVLKDALARHELIVADYYIRRGAWIAAAERAQAVVSNFHGVDAISDAWVVLIEAYNALDMPEDSAAALQRLKSDYPDHPTLKSGEYVSPKWEEDRWWVKALTLGLTS